jgi:hypothetical protein
VQLLKNGEKKNAELAARVAERERSIAELETRLAAQHVQAQHDLDVANRRIEHQSTNGAYILVLIDGDGSIFKHEYLQGGVQGGMDAAYALRNRVLERYSLGNLHEEEVITKIVVNLNGLKHALVSHGYLQNVQQFQDFCHGFTQAKALFDFVDVGPGKERTDHQIRGACVCVPRERLFFLSSMAVSC